MTHKKVIHGCQILTSKAELIDGFVHVYLNGYERIHLAFTPGLHAEAILSKMATRHVLCNFIFNDIFKGIFLIFFF